MHGVASRWLREAGQKLHAQLQLMAATVASEADAGAGDEGASNGPHNKEAVQEVVGLMQAKLLRWPAAQVRMVVHGGMR